MENQNNILGKSKVANLNIVEHLNIGFLICFRKSKMASWEITEVNGKFRWKKNTSKEMGIFDWHA